MLSPFPSCHRGPTALPAAHLNARRNWGGSSECSCLLISSIDSCLQGHSRFPGF